MRAAPLPWLLALLLAAPAAWAYPVPDVFVTGQLLLEQFDPNVKPKLLHAPDGTFVASLPAAGWATDDERRRHVRAIDAENGRWYIHAVFDASRGSAFCFSGRQRPDDVTFYEEALGDLRKLPRTQLQGRSAAALLVEVWGRKWPCGAAAGRKK